MYENIPPELIHKIALNLQYVDIINKCHTHSIFNNAVCNDEYFWKTKTNKDYPNQQMISDSWKKTYYILSHRNLYTFGTGEFGKLGHGNNNDSNVPKLVEPLFNVTQIACSDYFTAVLANGKLYTFGTGIYGELGHNYNIPNLVQDVPDVQNGFINNNITNIACGMYHTAVIANAQLYTFGSGTEGQLGYKSILSNAPKLVPDVSGGFINKNVSYVACGPFNTAIVANGLLYICGYGNEYIPYIPQLVQNLRNVTCVIANGQLYTFGYGNEGQLGHGKSDNVIIPKLVNSIPNGFVNKNVTKVSCNDYMTAVIANGLLYTFGNGEEAPIGHNSNSIIYVPTVVPNLQNVTHVSCSTIGTAIIANKRLYVFGTGDVFGRNRIPTLVSDVPNGFVNNNISQIACGSNHICVTCEIKQPDKPEQIIQPNIIYRFVNGMTSWLWK